AATSIPSISSFKFTERGHAPSAAAAVESAAAGEEAWLSARERLGGRLAELIASLPYSVFSDEGRDRCSRLRSLRPSHTAPGRDAGRLAKSRMSGTAAVFLRFKGPVNRDAKPIRFDIGSFSDVTVSVEEIAAVERHGEQCRRCFGIGDGAPSWVNGELS